jgi:transposase-like protein
VVERASLERLVELGLSLSEIGKRFGRDASTISYWLRKHGIEPVNRERHAARGGIARDVLEELIAQHLSIAEMARRVGCSATTVKYWLRKHGLQTLQSERRAEARRAKAAGRAKVTMRCRHHGFTEFWLEGRGA